MKLCPLTVGPASDRISESDGMYRGDTREHYFSVGRSALEQIAHALDAAEVLPQEVETILDLPCGHGRVTRFLRSAFPEASITACDLLTDGVDFCATEFNATPVYSTPEIEEIPLGDSDFDLIWVGSLLTHVDAERCERFLRFLAGHLRPRGVIVFSTHGALSHSWLDTRHYHYELNEESIRQTLKGYELEGFGYADYGPGSAYGVSLCKPAWIERLIHRTGLRLVYRAESAWDKHHDVFAGAR